jgi:hypothetical protein
MADNENIDNTMLINQLLEQIKAVSEELIASPRVPVEFKQALNGVQDKELP